jgi:hypothetical protein
VTESRRLTMPVTRLRLRGGWRDNSKRSGHARPTYDTSSGHKFLNDGRGEGDGVLE